MMGRWKGCLWIDLDERIAELQRTREELQTVTGGGSWRSKKLLKRVRRTTSDNSQPTSWYEMGNESEKLLGFGALYFDLQGVGKSFWRSTKGP